MNRPLYNRQSISHAKLRRGIQSIILILCLCVGLAHAGSAAGKITLIKGDVFILDSKATIVADPAGKRGRKTEVGAEFFMGETISTKPGARVKLQFVEGGNEVVLGSDTTMLIERAGNGSDKKGTTLNLSKGEVRSDVKVKYSGKGDDVYEVKSKNAVAGVRGTIFTAMFNPTTANFTVATDRGAVAVSSLVANAKPQLVTAGKFTVASGEQVAPPAPIASNPDLKAKVDKLGGGGSEKEKDKDSASSGGDAKASEGNSDKSADKSSDKGSDKSSDKSDKSADKSSDKSDQSSDKSADKKDDKKQESSRQADNSDSKSDDKPAAKEDSKAAAKNDSSGDSKSDAKSEPKSDAKSDDGSRGKGSNKAVARDDNGDSSGGGAKSNNSAPPTKNDTTANANGDAKQAPAAAGPPLGRETVVTSTKDSGMGAGSTTRGPASIAPMNSPPPAGGAPAPGTAAGAGPAPTTGGPAAGPAPGGPGPVPMIMGGNSPATAPTTFINPNFGTPNISLPATSNISSAINNISKTTTTINDQVKAAPPAPTTGTVRISIK